MAENNPVSDAIKLATQVLQSAFGENTELEGTDAFKYLQESSLTDIYLSELEHKSLADFLQDIPMSITKMRSSYLPVDLLQELSSALDKSVAEILQDSSSQKESYENTFMRMLGMPSSIFISQNTNVTMLNPNGEKESVDFTLIETEILNERQKPRVDRKIVIDNNIFNLDQYQYADIQEEEVIPDEDTDIDLFITNLEVQEESSINSSPNLSNIESELFHYLYLLIPPVQDHRISTCINEPSKIVPPNFSNKSGFQINNKPLSPSLLESVIRIRLDRLSGYSNLSTISLEETDEEVNSDDYGVLESLFILRLRCAIRAFAIKLSHEIDSLRGIYEQTKRVPVSDTKKNQTSRQIEDSRFSSQYAKVQGDSDDLAEGESVSLYEKQKIIEDSIMSLLDDNSDALDLQLNTQRKSSIKDSHLLSNLIGIIDLPRKRLEQKIKNKDIGGKDLTDGAGDRSRETVSSIIGSSKGIGAIHILSFMLALFTLPEDHLTGLLSDLEYERFLEEFGGAGNSNGVFGNFGTSPGIKKIETIIAINSLSDYILASYDLFKEDLNSSDTPLDIG